jgi:hypothetical protein
MLGEQYPLTQNACPIFIPTYLSFSANVSSLGWRPLNLVVQMDVSPFVSLYQKGSCRFGWQMITTLARRSQTNCCIRFCASLLLSRLICSIFRVPSGGPFPRPNPCLGPFTTHSTTWFIAAICDRVVALVAFAASLLARADQRAPVRRVPNLVAPEASHYLSYWTRIVAMVRPVHTFACPSLPKR